MKTSETTQALFSALVKARGEVKNLYPDAKGYGYQYVPLEAIIDHLRDVLPKHGLSYIQLPAGGDSQSVGLSTRIIHESGEWVEETATFPITDMKGVNKSQAAGAAITYFRRYGLASAFGISGDKDTDANTGKPNPVQDIVIAFETAEDMVQLKQIWDKSVKYHKHPDVIAAKDARKKELS